MAVPKIKSPSPYSLAPRNRTGVIHRDVGRVVGQRDRMVTRMLERAYPERPGIDPLQLLVIDNVLTTRERRVLTRFADTHPLHRFDFDQGRQLCWTASVNVNAEAMSLTDSYQAYQGGARLDNGIGINRGGGRTFPTEVKTAIRKATIAYLSNQRAHHRNGTRG